MTSCHFEASEITFSISCTVYEHGHASTVHSWYGLQDANMPRRIVVERAADNSLVRERVRSVDVIIWDEASMSSQRIFEIVNVLHHELAVDEVSKQHPFAGKQIILVGEFLQLKPVSSIFDEGNFMFLSPLFTLAIPHRFELTQVMCQSDPEFLFAISEIRMGKCSERTEQFLSFLQRDLQEDMERVATHIFFRKVNAHLFNMQKVSELEGELLSFNAEYQNDQSRSMSWPGQHRL